MNYSAIEQFCPQEQSIDCASIVENDNALTFILKNNHKLNIDISIHMLEQVILNSDLSFQDDNGDDALMLFFFNNKSQQLPEISDKVLYHLLSHSNLSLVNNKNRNALICALVNNKSENLNLSTDVFAHLCIWSDLTINDKYQSSAGHYFIYYYEKEGLTHIESEIVDFLILNSPKNSTEDGIDLYDLLMQSNNSKEIAKKISERTLLSIANTKGKKLISAIDPRFKSLLKLSKENFVHKEISSSLNYVWAHDMLEKVQSSIEQNNEEQSKTKKSRKNKENIPQEKPQIQWVGSSELVTKKTANDETVEEFMLEDIQNIDFTNKSLTYIFGYFSKVILDENINTDIEKIKKGLSILKTNFTPKQFEDYLNTQKTYFADIAKHYEQIRIYNENFNNIQYLEQAQQMVGNSLHKLYQDIEQNIFNFTEQSLSSMKILSQNFLK